MMAKPSSVQIVAIIWIISGILTILWGFGLVAAALASFIGILCLPLSIYPFIVGVVELIYGIKLASSPVSVAKPPLFVSVMEMGVVFWGDICLNRRHNYPRSPEGRGIDSILQ